MSDDANGPVREEPEFVPPTFTQALRSATGGTGPDRKWVLIAIPVCIALGVLELLRAIGGNGRSWAYTIEWPFFAAFIAYMYWKLGQPQDEWDEHPAERPDEDAP